MNKSLLLRWLVEDAERNGDRYGDQRIKLEEALRELNNRKEILLPPSLPKRPEDMIPVLREHFKDNVTFISLVLNHYFPDKFLFYRASKLEKEIFEGLELFKEIVPEFATLQFPRVGGTGFGRYLKLNEILLNFAHSYWPKQKKPQRRLMYFLYEGLGHLFLEKSDYQRYWVAATHEEYFEDLDTGDKDISWSARKEMRPGDLVFVYRTAPRKAITDILQVKEDPVFDPWGAWDGFWVNLKKVCTIEDIPFADMRKDDVLGKWGTVKKFFVGVVAEPVSPVIYNRLLKKIPETLRKKHHLEFAEVVQSKSPPPRGLTQLPTIAWDLSGQFPTEAKFEEEVIIPMLKRWGFKYSAQHGCPFRVGSQDYWGWIDFLVSDKEEPLTLFEDKLRIVNDKDLKPAVDQAKSYALLLGLPSFVVASPEGMWVYALDRNQEQLVSQPSADEGNREEEIKSLLLKLR